MPDQQIYQLVHCTVNGEVQPKEDEWNVGIKTTSSYVITRLNKIKIGQRVRITFEAEIPPTKKGMNPAKSIKPEAGGMDPDFKTPEMLATESVNEVF